MRSVGIDIGRYSIKVVEVTANNRSYQITRAKVYPILNPRTNDQEIDILQTLKTISEEFETESAKVTTSIRQQYVTLRKLFFPFREKAKIQKSIAFELEDDIPLSIEKAIYDSKVIRYHDKAAEVIAMACVTDEVENTIDIFNRGHVDPDIISPEFSAIANLYEKWYKAPQETSPEDQTATDKLVVFIGHAKTFAGVVRGNHLIWGRSTLWGAEKIAASIARSFQVPYMEALKIMPEKAFLLLSTEGAQKDQIKMSNAVSEALLPLIQTLRLTIMLANTEYGTNISSIELIGGASKVKNIGPFFTQALEKPTNSVNPLDSLNKDQVKKLLPMKDSCHIAFGLAIEGMKRPINPSINFRQMHLAKKNLSFEKFWEKWGYTTKLLCVAYFCYLAYGITKEMVAIDLEDKSRETLSSQASKIAGLKGSQATQGRIKSYIKANNKKAKLVKIYDEISEINTPVKWIHDVSQILPNNKINKDYEVRQFFVKNNKVTIQGVTTTDKAQSNLLNALKGVAINGKVTPIKATILKEPNKKVFAYTFNVNRKN